MKRRRKKIELKSEEKKKYLEEIISYFKSERDEEIGLVAAEEFLDFFVNTIGDEIYRKAIKDIQTLLKERSEDLDIELNFLLEK